MEHFNLIGEGIGLIPNVTVSVCINDEDEMKALDSETRYHVGESGSMISAGEYCRRRFNKDMRKLHVTAIPAK